MALLEVDRLVARYGDFQALYGVTLSVEAGQVVAVIDALMARARARCSRPSPA